MKKQRNKRTNGISPKSILAGLLVGFVIIVGITQLTGGKKYNPSRPL